MSYLKAMSAISRLFREIEVPYMLVGGFAVAYWGYPRQSLDIDIVIDLDKDNLEVLLKAAKKKGFSFDQREAELIVQKGNRFVMELNDFRIDCWLPRSRFEKEALKRRKKKRVFGMNLNIIGPEDLMLSKLLIGRERDMEDIKTIILRQGKKLNSSYLKNQAAVLDVDLLLKKELE
ncbi:MAG: hypothetical protein AABZ57_03110 [Candidatus Margulisiibacteriota bacterium]